MSAFLPERNSHMRRAAPGKSCARESASGEKALDNSCQQIPLASTRVPCMDGCRQLYICSTLVLSWSAPHQLYLGSGWFRVPSLVSTKELSWAQPQTESARALPHLYTEKPKVKSKAEEPGGDEAVLEDSTLLN